MIRSLHISNYALISQINIDFSEGLNIITGETGAGKSIILGALGLLLGGRADLRAVRDSGAKSIIEATFAIDGHGTIERLLREADLDMLPGECILRRELSPGGRSRAFINDTPVGLATLRDVAMRLVDIHSQHQNLLISDPAYQLRIIDSLAGNDALLEDYRAAYAAYRKALKAYTDTRESIRRSQSDAEYLQFQYDRLVELNLKAGEQESLERERDILGNITEIKERVAAVSEPLSGRSGCALALLSEAASACETLASGVGEAAGDSEDEAHGAGLRALAERLQSARIELRDIADSLQAFDNSLQADPGRLEEVEERLSELYSLEMKHHVESSEALIELRDRLGEQLKDLNDSENVLSELETKARRAKKEAMLLAQKLSDLRAATAESFAEMLKTRAMPLGMPNLRCEVALTKDKLGPDGADRIEFLFAFNKNQALTPVGGTASGGEISRLMLCIKSIVAEKMELPSIIFDEVDTGVSGDIAQRMAEMMSQIGRKIQVITITHLPGVAAHGHRHFKVYKEDDESATHTYIRALSEAERAPELALMLSGSATDPAAIANAKALLKKAKA
ncbi:MAG: DNA repair protein RecN [Muribaculaceae bacterium]|nr:DNA repair protein RecN [Muribaculaceae bacterium]